MSMSTATMPGIFRQDATVISLVGFAHGTSHFFHLMLPPLFPWLMSEYSLSFTQICTLMTVFYFVSGIGQALAGFLVCLCWPVLGFSSQGRRVYGDSISPHLLQDWETACFTRRITLC